MSSGSTPPLPNDAGGFVSLTKPPVTSFITSQVPAPTALYIAPEAFIQVGVRNANLGGVTIIIRSRLLRASDGQITESEDTFTLADHAGNFAFFNVNLAEGFLLSVTASTPGTGKFRGQIFVQINLCRGLVTNPRIEQVLASDYSTSNAGVGWPLGLIRQSVEGPGALVTHNVANPAPGADFNVSFTSISRIRILTVSCTLVTSAAVGNRLPEFIFSDGLGTIFQRYPLSSTIPASQTVHITWAAGMGGFVGSLGSEFVAPIPAIAYNSFGTPGSNTIGMQAADQYSSIIVQTEEWIES